MSKLFTAILVVAVLVGFSQTLEVQPLANPAAPGSLQPNWSAAPDGSPLLSWVEPSKSGALLRYAIRRGSAWSEPRTVVANRHFFRHPAEVPEVLAVSDHQWMAHWVEAPAEGSDAEYVYVSSSSDGVRWTPPAMAHKDRSPVEHGLASMAANANGEISLFWLEMPKGEDGPGYLMRTVVDASGKEVKEERLDPDVCECCPTAVARTAQGLLVAYRGRTPANIRDILTLRLENGQWSKPKVLHADNWSLNACPTNAASVAAKGNRAAVAWYTGAQNSPRVEVAFSRDNGTTFDAPVVVSTGHAFGYASVALDEAGWAIVSWLEDNPGGSTRVLARSVTAAGAPGPVIALAEGGKSTLGYPRVFGSSAGAFIAWGNAKPGIETARFDRKK
jgi:BNR repeat-like domain